MNGLAAKFSWEGRRAGIPEVAVGNNHLGVGADLAGRQMNIPASVRRLFYRFDGGLERCELADPEMVRITFEISQKLRMRQKIGHALRNREIRISQIVTAGIDMEARIGRRQAVVVLIPPHSADVRAFLEAIESDATLVQRLCHGNS